MATIKCPHCGAIIEDQVFADGAVAMCFKCHEHFTMTAECVVPAAADRIDPPHYKDGFPRQPIECIDVVGRLPFCIGNAIKYVWRAGKKPGAAWREDLAKARWYLRRWLDMVAHPAAYTDALALLRMVDIAGLSPCDRARLDCINAILGGEYSDVSPIDAFEKAYENLCDLWK